MALVLLEGLDRTGKSTVAAYFETLGFEKIHLSAPPKGTTADQYLQEIVDLISSAATKDIVMDRTHYGELVWPQVYGTPNKPRYPLLTEDDFEMLREIEQSVGVQRIWMTDDDLKGHWQRCVDNNEPLDKAQFTRARGLFSSMAAKYGFEKVTLQTFVKEFPEAQKIIDEQKGTALATKTMQVAQSGDQTVTTEVDTAVVVSSTSAKYPGKTKEQHKLEVANAINEVLSKRILKSKGIVYDDIENEIRHFLNTKLGKLFSGADTQELNLTQEEIKFFKMMYKKATT